MPDFYPHIKLPGPNRELSFTTPQSGGGSNNIPQRNRESHGNYIKQCLETAWRESENEFVINHSVRNGTYLEFISSPNFELAVKSLEDLRQGIRLCNVRTERQEIQNSEITKTYATVYIPNTKKQSFFKKIEKYLNEESSSGKPKNANLINSIEELRKALLIESFWLDDKNLIPEDTPEWCEVWLRGDSDEILNRFDELITRLEIMSKSGFIKFPERTVKLVQLTNQHLQNLTLYSDNIAEYRRAKVTADFVLNLSPLEQQEWGQDLIDRLSINNDSQVSICILDTGINSGHPLVQPVLSNADCQAVKSEWGVNDHEGHGTLMAGIAIYGDLQNILESPGTIEIKHVLESVKILPPQGQNKPELWGDFTSQAISLAEINSPDKKRIYCMAITSFDIRDRGRPSSWSAAIDKITSGVDDNVRRLLIISAGNITDISKIEDYPDIQLIDSIHDPAQSWNALVVGAYTKLTNITDPDLVSHSPLALENQLSPFTTTS